VQLWRRDQYERVVATVYIRRGIFGFLFRKDVSLEMLKHGLATVYEAKFGSEFGSREQMYRDAEEKAKRNKTGMWKEKSVWERITGGGVTLETPREFKTRMKASEKDK
jgi:endonuclease YncB( thermonuclease family)